MLKEAFQAKGKLYHIKIWVYIKALSTLKMEITEINR